MKPSLQFRLSQHLTLTPQLQQSIRLLQLSTVELNQEIDRLLMENPALEREDIEDGGDAPRSSVPKEEVVVKSAADAPAEAPAEGAAPEADWAGELAAGWRSGGDDEDADRTHATPDTPTLREHLLAQLSPNLSETDRGFVGVLIEALDDDGRLTQPLEEIATLIEVPAEQVEALREELQIALCHLQQLEPAGVGARSLSECVMLQLKTLDDDAGRALALQIAEKHLDAVGKRDYTRLKLLTGADDDALRAALRLIRACNPKPGAAFAKVEAQYVVPDVVVRKQKNVWKASLNPEAMPRLRINRLYAELAAKARSGTPGVSSQLQEARWLIKNVKQRFDTILRVSQAIVDRQRNFFEHGPVSMRPLVLSEIAAEVGTHESTISRVTTQKFMATQRGTFELKYFFSSHVATDAGGAASSTAVCEMIKQFIAAENPKAPLSDSNLAQALLEKGGIKVARRTVAKYRESMQIPPVNQRKAL
jgi:RNA polymerase sigma-54 factor